MHKIKKVFSILLIFSFLFLLFPISPVKAADNVVPTDTNWTCKWNDNNNVTCTHKDDGFTVNMSITEKAPEGCKAVYCTPLIDGDSWRLVSSQKYEITPPNWLGLGRQDSQIMMVVKKDYTSASFHTFINGDGTIDWWLNNASVSVSPLFTLKNPTFDTSNATLRRTANVSKEIPKGTAINGLVEFKLRTSGEFIQPEWVTDNLQVGLFQGVAGGESVNVAGSLQFIEAHIGNLARHLEKKGSLWRYLTFTTTEPLYTNTVYVVGVISNQNNWVSCVTGHDDAWWFVKGNGCALSYRGYTSFTIDENKKIHIVGELNDSSFVHKGEGKDVTSLTPWSDGVNILISENLDSPLDAALSSAIKNLASMVEVGLNWTMTWTNNMLVNTEKYVLANGVEGAWVKMRNVSLILLTLGLLIIAFANALQIDIENYGLNRMIPRIIISIIMAYSSWLIVLFFFDFTAALQGQAIGLMQGTNGLDYLGNLQFTTPTSADIIGKFGAIILLIILIGGAWVAGAVLLFTLIARIVVLSFLLAVAPFAFMMNIMPFTQTLYKRWWTEFWKWMFMGPVALVIIALGSVIATGASADFVSNVTLNDATITSSSGGGILISIIIFAAALYFAATLPLQWGGKIMQSWSGVGKKIWGATGGFAMKSAWDASGGRAVNRTKSFFALRRQKRDDADRIAVSGAMNKLTAGDNKGFWRNRLAGNSLFSKEIAEAQRQSDYQKHIGDLTKTYGIDQLDESEAKKRLHAMTGMSLTSDEWKNMSEEDKNKKAKELAENPLGAAYFKYIAAKGWTDNSVGSLDSRLFHVLMDIDKNIAEAIRDKNRTMLLTSEDPSHRVMALDDAGRRNPSDFSTEEMKTYIKHAENAVANGLHGSEAEKKYNDLRGKLTRTGSLSADETREMTEAGSLRITYNLSGQAVGEIAKKGGDKLGHLETAAASQTNRDNGIFSPQTHDHLTGTSSTAPRP